MDSRRQILGIAIAGLLTAATLGSVFAQEQKKTDDDKPADPDTGESTTEERTLGLLPNPLQKHGIKFAATYIGEVMGNVSGGLKQGAIYEGRLNLAVDADFEKLLGLQQLTFHANVFQIHGDGLSRSNLQNFMTASGIEALPSTRLYEMYFEKQWGAKTVSLKFGQIAADSEFFNTKYTDVFTNSSMGWPAITSLDLPSGGPSPPLAAVGARILVNVDQHLSLLGGIFDGDAAGPGQNDPQERNRYGLNFRVNDPPLVLGQIQYAWNNRKGDLNLTGQFKLGGWRHFGSFGDERLPLTVFRWPPRRAAAPPQCFREIMESGRLLSSRSTGCRAAMTGASAFLAARRRRRPIAISSIFTPMPVSSSSV